jgi:hypothetical protein
MSIWVSGKSLQTAAAMMCAALWRTVWMGCTFETPEFKWE